MSSHSVPGIAILICVLGIKHAVAVQVPSSAAIAGRVLADGHPGRYVEVDVIPEGGDPFTVLADAEGRYVAQALPSGRYRVIARQHGFVGRFFGATEHSEPGVTIALTDGEAVHGIDVVLERGGVIAGAVATRTGAMARGVRVQALRLDDQGLPVLGRPRGTETGVLTDSRGNYRIFGLAPGGYLVVAHALTPPAVRYSDGDLSRLLNGQSVPHPVTVQEQMVPAYYPGVVDVGEAVLVPVRGGESVEAVNFQLQAVILGRVEGRVVTPGGVGQATVTLRPARATAAIAATGGFGSAATRSNRDGSFTIAGVPPGNYTLYGEARDPADGTRYSGAVNARVFDGGVVQSTLSLDPEVRVSGRVVVRGAGSQPRDVQIIMNPISVDDGNPGQPIHAPVDVRGSFSFYVPAGRYLLQVSAEGEGADAWRVESVAAHELELTDREIALFAGSSIGSITVSISTTKADLIGTANAETMGRCIVAFPLEEALWLGGSRRIRMARIDTKYRFYFRAVPPGEYSVGTSEECRPGIWSSLSNLRRVREHSIRVVIRPGEEQHVEILYKGVGG